MSIPKYTLDKTFSTDTFNNLSKGQTLQKYRVNENMADTNLNVL